MEEESGASRRDEERIRDERQGSEAKWRVKWEGEIEEGGYRGLAEEKETKEDEEADSAGEGESVGAGCEACWEQLPQWRWRWRILWRVRACRDRANRALAACIERGNPSLPSQSSDPWHCSTGKTFTYWCIENIQLIWTLEAEFLVEQRRSFVPPARADSTEGAQRRWRAQRGDQVE
jgi:hypothetical protein